MYAFVLNVHGLFRWIVLIAAVYALVRAYRGWLRAEAWSVADRRAGVFFSSALDLQVLSGIVLAFISPLIQNALFGLQAAMQAPHLRFFLVEHIPLMLAALVLVHIGSRMTRAVADDRLKHRRAALMFTLATLAIIVAIPWWRPAFPGLG